MKKLSAIFFTFLIGFVGVGCDSNGDNDDPSIADLLVGVWELTGVSDADGDQFTVFAQGFNSLEFTFTQAGAITIGIDAIDDAGDTVITGTYSIDESASRIAVTTEAEGVPIILNFTYAFNGDDEVTFAADSVASILLNALLVTTLQGSISLTISRT